MGDTSVGLRNTVVGWLRSENPQASAISATCSSDRMVAPDGEACDWRSNLHREPVRQLTAATQAGASFNRPRYCRTGSRKPSLLVTVVPPTVTRMKSPRGVRLISFTCCILTRQERLMRSIGCPWNDFSACCNVLRAWKRSLPMVRRT